MTSSSLKIGFVGGIGCGGVCCAAAEMANKNNRTNRGIGERSTGPPTFLFSRELTAKYINPRIVSASRSIELPIQAKRRLEWATHTPDPNYGLLLLSHFLDALFQHVHGDVGFFFGHHQRRAEADRAWAAAEEQEAVFEGLFDDQV